MWIWRKDHRAVPIGLSQCFVLWPLEREISQAIVHEVDIVPIERKSAAVIAKTASIGDKCVNTPLGQNLPCQHELGIEILLLRTIIDDSGPVGCAGSPLAPPLALEHPEDCVLEAVPGGARRRLYDCTARALRPREERVEERPTGVCIDLD